MDENDLKRLLDANAAETRTHFEKKLDSSIAETAAQFDDKFDRKTMISRSGWSAVLWRRRP